MGSLSSLTSGGCDRDANPMASVECNRCPADVKAQVCRLTCTGRASTVVARQDNTAQSSTTSKAVDHVHTVLPDVATVHTTPHQSTSHQHAPGASRTCRSNPYRYLARCAYSTTRIERPSGYTSQTRTITSVSYATRDQSHNHSCHRTRKGQLFGHGG
jgi:hypothetical protein